MIPLSCGQGIADYDDGIMGWLQIVVLEINFSGQPAGNPARIRVKTNWNTDREKCTGITTFGRENK